MTDLATDLWRVAQRQAASGGARGPASRRPETADYAAAAAWAARTEARLAVLKPASALNQSHQELVREDLRARRRRRKVVKSLTRDLTALRRLPADVLPLVHAFVGHDLVNEFCAPHHPFIKLHVNEIRRGTPAAFRLLPRSRRRDIVARFPRLRCWVWPDGGCASSRHRMSAADAAEEPVLAAVFEAQGLANAGSPEDAAF